MYICMRLGQLSRFFFFCANSHESGFEIDGLNYYSVISESTDLDSTTNLPVLTTCRKYVSNLYVHKTVVGSILLVIVKNHHSYPITCTSNKKQQ